MRKWAWLLVLFAVPALHAQVSNPGVRYVTTAPSGACSPFPPIQVVTSTGVAYTCNNGTWAAISGGGGGGTPGGSTTQGQYNNAGAFAGSSAETFRTADGTLSQLANVQYLSAGSDIGAQCNTAVTALGATGGVIVLPNSASVTMSTTCTNIPKQISIRGYGKWGTIVKCSVVGDCFQLSMNPTTTGEIGSELSNFSMVGSNTGQTLIHLNGASGYSMHDIQLGSYPGNAGDTATVCLELDNSANGLFFEDNWFDIGTERNCTTGVLFNQGTDSSSSFGYNHFRFHVASQGSNFALVFNGGGVLYGGDLKVFGNHIGPGGGLMQFNNAFGTGSSSATGDQRIDVDAEENGSGAGVIISATGTNVLRFTGEIVNGAGGAPALATVYSIGGSAGLQHNEVGFASSTLSYLSQSTKPIAMEWDNSGDIIIPNGSLSVSSNVLQVGGSSFTPSSNIAQFTGNWAFGTSFGLSNTSSGGQPWGVISEGSGALAGALGFSNGTNWAFTLYEPGSGAARMLALANGSYSWSTATTFPSTNAQAAGLTQSSGTISADTSTPGNHAATFDAGAYQVGGVAGVTKTCTSAIVVVSGIITGCT